MYIKTIKIKNFRGIDLEIDDLKKNNLIIGKNNAGKTNFCRAIQKVLDPGSRRIPLQESDSTDSNMKDISIIITLKLENISDNNRANIGKFVDRDEESGEETITIEFIGKFNNESQLYEESIFLGTSDKSNEIATNKLNALDKVLEIIYINPNYDLNKNTKDFFNFYRIENQKNNEQIGKDISIKINELNNSISSDNNIKTMQNEISSFKFNEIIQNIVFKIESNFDISNIYKSLRITPTHDSKTITTGDGTSKMLAFALQKIINNNEKEKIVILEEPENHLFPLLQKQFMSWVQKLSFSQIWTTTHSPEIIDFRKTNEIIKFQKKEDKFEIYRTNINSKEIYKNFGFALNKEIAESFFYDSVLLIEGYSEKIFYNTLINNDENFRQKTLNKSIGIVCVYGVDFLPSKQILESLGIKVKILTDNDINKVPYKDYVKYSGIQRGFDFISDDVLDIDGIKFTKESFSVEENSPDHTNIKNNLDNIMKIFESYSIYLNKDGFETSVVQFIEREGNKNEGIIKKLKKAKMKNLHNYLVEKIDCVRVDEKKKNNILVRFLYEE